MLTLQQTRAMTKPLVSILIPFFNEEAVIEKAITSCLNQTYDSIELILVDDFSSDRSVEIVKSFDSSNLILGKAKEKGVGYARNKAIELMSGEYCAFLDADDELDPYFVETSLNKLREFESDVAVFGTKVFNTEGKEISKQAKESHFQVYSGQEALIKMYDYEIVASVWGKLFTAHFLKKQQFEVGFVFEDKPFLVELLLKSNRVLVGSSNLYLHFANPNSITRSVVSEQRIADSTFSFFKELETLTSTNQCKTTLHRAFVYQLNCMVDIFLMIWLDRKNLEQKKMYEVFQRNLTLILEKSVSLSIDYSLKRRILLKILKVETILGARLPFLLVSRYYPTQFRFIKNIKK